MDELQRRGTVSRTDLDDAACRTNPAKIGRDRTGAGGCDHVQVAIGATGTITPSNFRRAD